MSQPTKPLQNKHIAPMSGFKALLRKRELWAALIAVGIILAILAPFGTGTHLRFVPAVAYWSVVACVTFLSASFLALICAPTDTRSPSVLDWLRLVVIAGLIGLVLSCEVLLLNWAIFDLSPVRLSYSLPLIGNTIAVTAVIFAAMRFTAKKGENTAALAEAADMAPSLATTAPPTVLSSVTADSKNATPALLARLPFDKRGQLISLEVQDHYVDVTTTKGSALILMRLSDAILEAGNGYQVHRSHWVAADQIAAVRKTGPKAVITTQDGRDIPVSRTYVPVLKEAGFLP